MLTFFCSPFLTHLNFETNMLTWPAVRQLRVGKKVPKWQSEEAAVRRSHAEGEQRKKKRERERENHVSE